MFERNDNKDGWNGFTMIEALQQGGSTAPELHDCMAVCRSTIEAYKAFQMS